MNMTKLPLKIKAEQLLSTTQLYTDTNIKQEELIISPTSSPSPPASSPHSPEEVATVPSSPPEFPEVITLVQRLNPFIEDLEKKRVNSSEFSKILQRELILLFAKNQTSGPKKTKKKRDRGSRQCSICRTESTPEWRRDPDGIMTLCNACGLKEKKKAKISPQGATNSQNGNHRNAYPSAGLWNQQQQQQQLPQPQLPKPTTSNINSKLPSVSSHHLLQPIQNTSPTPLSQFFSYQLRQTSAPAYKTDNITDAFYQQGRGFQPNQTLMQPNLQGMSFNQPMMWNYYNDDSFPYQLSAENSYLNHIHGDCHDCSYCNPYPTY